MLRNGFGGSQARNQLAQQLTAELPDYLIEHIRCPDVSRCGTVPSKVSRVATAVAAATGQASGAGPVDIHGDRRGQ